MTRQHRRILARAGVAVAALVVVLNAWSFYRIEMVQVRCGRPWQVDLFQGVVYLESLDVPIDDLDVTWTRDRAWAYAYYWKFQAVGKHVMGFSVIRPSPGYVIVGAPIWPLMLIGAGAWGFLRERRGERKLFAPEQAKCESCGYALRESVDHCPECGAYINCATVAQQREVLAAAARLADATHDRRASLE